MSNSVLCAVDVSHGDEDLKTIQMAARLAALDGAQLDVVAVIPDYGMTSVAGFFDKDHHEKMVADAKVLLDEVVTKALDDARNANVRHIVATGRAYEEILKLANTTKPALIVVGAHKPDLSDYLIGPNASRIVRHAKCSVYVVRDT
ncbi:universal stress protein [Sulfitobacter mediterraneus]|jgi:universal stress protein F|uniref:universal stress protein n=1 Tax=Sulfitobacter TaxID=60136 RepID=UPI0019314E29|nr:MULTISPECIES: universal stress protein [Sulfitobacter]MBM1633924.1 universal stress protein [Sulfitobacter mediterraneus]MBM1641561.1 universal stress protein [Sulfitobacter mediterraneus]MBM1645788.1 universal stress protein [Sulfitobacter mediterraneus]MBM1649680.1 universal stress protein [Sulfitobacter mediterraneus]MBM1653857.1 universal stress protein [Sulfitobacter mediterraneus]